MKSWGKFFFCSLCISLAVSSCTKESDLIGLEVQPPSDQLNIFFTDTLSLVTVSLREDSLRIDKAFTQNNLLGSINDPLLGTTRAGFYTQLLLPFSNVNFGTAPVLDSIILSMAYKGYYGDTTTMQTVNVYRMTEAIHTDSSYYTNQVFATEASPLVTYSFQPRPTDSVVVASFVKKVAPQIRINLGNTFGNEILSASTADLASNTAFLAFLKGLYVTAESVSSAGAISYIDYASSHTKVTLYYNDSLSLDLVINDNNARITHFEHDYPGSIVFGDALTGSNSTYVQTTAGVKTKVSFPHLKDMKREGNVAINKAELIVRVLPGSETPLAPVEKFIIFASDTAGKNVIITDQFEGSSFVGGNYESGSKVYKFTITRHIQELLNGTKDDLGLFIVSSNAVISANRTALGGSNHPTHRMSLRLTYTKVE